MSVLERVLTLRIIDKIKKDTDYANKIGVSVETENQQDKNTLNAPEGP